MLLTPKSPQRLLRKTNRRSFNGETGSIRHGNLFPEPIWVIQACRMRNVTPSNATPRPNSADSRSPHREASTRKKRKSPLNHLFSTSNRPTLPPPHPTFKTNLRPIAFALHTAQFIASFSLHFLHRNIALRFMHRNENESFRCFLTSRLFCIRSPFPVPMFLSSIFPPFAAQRARICIYRRIYLQKHAADSRCVSATIRVYAP